MRKPNPKAEKWVKANLVKLLAHGWTKDQLFKPGKFSYPHGEWGIIYTQSWPCEPELNSKGEIVFKIQGTNGSFVIQKIYPRKRVKNGD